MLDQDFSTDRFCVRTGKGFRLADHDPAWAETGELAALCEKDLKKKAKRAVKTRVEDLSEMQRRLYADDRYAVLIIFQAMDAAGKDGTIRHVMSGINPQGCQVFSFKVPSKEELDHNYLWRYNKGLPERGRIGIFNRSYYEEVLVLRVHPEYLAGQPLPPQKIDEAFWQARYEDINAFERHLMRNGTEIIKFFLNVSKEEQKRRFLERLDNPDKNWKFSQGDIAERGHWDAYMTAFEKAIAATTSEAAPWYVIPADHKWVMRALVSQIITERLGALNLQYPKPAIGDAKDLARAREKLFAEGT
jgi:PPK2 family polyphosphate:nucleotide phosphotransferase